MPTSLNIYFMAMYLLNTAYYVEKCDYSFWNYFKLFFRKMIQVGKYVNNKKKYANQLFSETREKYADQLFKPNCHCRIFFTHIWEWDPIRDFTSFRNSYFRKMIQVGKKILNRYFFTIEKVHKSTFQWNKRKIRRSTFQVQMSL